MVFQRFDVGCDCYEKFNFKVDGLKTFKTTTARLKAEGYRPHLMFCRDDALCEIMKTIKKEKRRAKKRRRPRPETHHPAKRPQLHLRNLNPDDIDDIHARVMQR